MTKSERAGRSQRDMRAEWAAIERQANGPVPAPERIEIGSADSAFDAPPTWPAE